MAADREALRAKLKGMKAELEHQEAISEADRDPVELDQTSVGRLSRIDAMQVQAMALANQQRRRSELERIRHALRRIDSEEFGYCIKCGEEIAEGRISHNPAVTTCIECAG
ncbi:MAG: TraR/DksA family transcriptional regulator [Allosphingosinicella sp.]|uniref:TraR/DksA family transcriptional regulator n=1 Tax=Allosphingosinicella sp. TaxID=2823234 RepID=UPI00395DFECB